MNPSGFDPLEAFLAWFLNGWRGGLFPSVHNGITRIGDYTGIVLYRQAPYQVELWILPPNTEAPEHSHPNADIFLVHVTGEIKVWVGNDLVLGPDQTVPDQNGVTKSNGSLIRIPPGTPHRAATGPLDGAFMNVQCWMDGNPRSTDSDWTGVPLNEEHKKKLGGVVYVKSARTISGSSIKEQPNTSTKGPVRVDEEVPFPEISARELLTPSGPR